MDLLCLICLPVPDAHSRQSVEGVLINPHASTAYRMKLTFHKLFTERTLSPILKAPPIKEARFDARGGWLSPASMVYGHLIVPTTPPHPRACLGPFHCGYGLIMYKEASICLSSAFSVLIPYTYLFTFVFHKIGACSLNNEQVPTLRCIAFEWLCRKFFKPSPFSSLKLPKVWNTTGKCETQLHRIRQASLLSQ